MRKIAIILTSLTFFLFSCMDGKDKNGGNVTKSSVNDIVQFELPGQTGPAVIHSANHTVNIEVVNGTDLRYLTPTIIVSAGAAIDPQSGDLVDFSSGSVGYTVTAEDGTRQLWEVTVTEAAFVSSSNNILTFELANQTDQAIIDVSNHTVTIEVSSGTGLTGLSPTITISGGAAISPLSGASVDFDSGPVSYTVEAEDGTEQIWTVTVTEAASSANDILGFSLTNQTGPATIDEENHTVVIKVSAGTGLTGLTPTITISGGAAISPLSGASVDFDSGPVSYTVESEDGTEQIWTVTVTEAASSANDILGFSLANQTGPAVINSTAGTVAIQILYNSNMSALCPAMSVSDKASILPGSGVAVDFSSGPAGYVVTAEDGSQKTWTVTVDGIHVPPVSDNAVWYKKIDSNTDSSEFGKTVKIDSEDSVYVISTGINYDWWLIKYSKFGAQQWEEKYDGAGPAMAIDSNNNVYAAGVGKRFITIDGKTKTYCYWNIKKFSSDGVGDLTNWNKEFEAGFAMYDEIHAIAIDSNDNVYVAGSGSKLISSTSKRDLWIKKFTSDGVEDTTNWDKKIDGNGGDDTVHSLAIDSSDNVFAACKSQNIVTSSSGYDIWIKKYSSDGVEDSANWDKKFDFNNDNDSNPHVAIDSDDNIYVAGTGKNLVSDSSSSDWFIKKYSNDGVEDTTRWDKKFDGNSDSDAIYSITIDSNNNLYVAGYGKNLISSTSNLDCWIKKFLSDGVEDTLEWNMMFDQNEWTNIVSSIAVDSSNNIFMVGYGYNLKNSHSYFDAWLMKYMY
ncbi:MAG: hypothetical protein GY754_24390 [bacterium]|nr:hypothetical protein [bacterium]